MQTLDGKAFSKKIQAQVKDDAASFLAKHGRKPGLATILVGDDPASAVYVGHKHRACKRVGLDSFHFQLPADVSEAELLALIEKNNADALVDGILVQLPLPKHLAAQKILATVAVEKDVDGFHPLNQGALFRGEDGLFPCTPSGVIKLLQEYKVPMAGKHAVILGRSNIVGKPMAHLLLAQHATVSICHSRTLDLPAFCRQADIIVAAVGRPEMVKKEWVKPGACVVDVGINRLESGKLVGDVAFEEVSDIAGFVSPVPGGVGPLTIAMLLSNTLQAAKKRTR